MSNLEALKVLKNFLLVLKISAEEEAVSEGVYALIAEMHQFASVQIQENENEGGK